MRKTLNNFKKYLKTTVEMTVVEKRRIRNVLLGYMNKPQEKLVASPYVFRMNVKRVMQKTTQLVTAVLVIALTLGTGLAQASQGALPGEILYPVKITAEEVISATKTTSEDKVDWEIERTSRRMGEAVRLAVDKKLDKDKQELLANTIQGHAEKITVEVEKLEVSNPSEALGAHAKLKTSLEAHTEALETIKRDIKEEREPKIVEELSTEELDISQKDIPVTAEEILQEEITLAEEAAMKEQALEELEENINKIIEVASKEVKNAEKKKIVLEERLSQEKPKEKVSEKENKLAYIKELKKKIEDVEAKIAKFKKIKAITQPITETTEVELPEIVEEEIIIDPEVPEVLTQPSDPSEPQVFIAEEVVVEKQELTDEEVLEEVLTVQDAPITEEEVLQENLSEATSAETELVPEQIVEEKTEIEKMKEQAEVYIELQEYGKAVVILEDLYQILLKQDITQEIEDMVEITELSENEEVAEISVIEKVSKEETVEKDQVEEFGIDEEIPTEDLTFETEEKIEE